MVRVQAGTNDFSLLEMVNRGSEAHKTYFLGATWGTVSGSKAYSPSLVTQFENTCAHLTLLPIPSCAVLN
jgi:hypothetical protein